MFFISWRKKSDFNKVVPFGLNSYIGVVEFPILIELELILKLYHYSYSIVCILGANSHLEDIFQGLGFKISECVYLYPVRERG